MRRDPAGANVVTKRNATFRLTDCSTNWPDEILWRNAAIDLHLQWVEFKMYYIQSDTDCNRLRALHTLRGRYWAKER